MHHLVVINPFGGRAAGDVITDPEEVELLLQSHADRVVRFVAPQSVATQPAAPQPGSKGE